MTEARWFVRMAAVLVGLVKLVVLAQFFGGQPALPTGVVWKEVSPRDAIPSVLAAVAAALVTAEGAIRRFDRMSAFGRFVFFEKLSYRRAGIVGTVCLGGALMGVSMSAVFVLQGSLGGTGTLTLLERAVVGVLGTSVFGFSFGAALGTIEGLFLAPPLAAILGGLEDGPSSRTTA